MDECFKQRLDKNRVELIEDLLVEDVADQLIQDGILSYHDHELISHEKTSKDRARKLVDVIRQKGDSAYGKFRLSLIGKYDWLVEKLDSTEVSALETVGVAVVSYDAFKINHKTLFVLSHHPLVMKDWISLAHLLDVPESDIIQIQFANSTHVSNAVYEMFNMWHSRKGKKATPAALAEALCNAEMQEALEKALEKCA